MKFFDGLMLVAKAKKQWAPLPRVDIAIFDTQTGVHLARVIRGYSFFSIDFRGESYHIPTLLAAFGQYLLYRGKVSISVVYFRKFILKLGARICITNQDANIIFFELDKQIPNVRFIALQQGLKSAGMVDYYSGISGDYFAFGQAYADALANGMANMHVCGSIKANVARLSGKKHRRVCYLSSFNGHDPGMETLKNVSYGEFLFPAIYTSLREIDRFCSKGGIELIIAARANRILEKDDRNRVLKREWDLYKNVLGRDPPLVMSDVYELAGESELVTCDQSAVGYELLGRGCKVVFINLIAYYHREKSYWFGWPLELPGQGDFWTNQYDPGYIQNMLNRIWSMSTEEWKNLVSPYQDQLMHYDPGNSILLSHIDSILNPGTLSIE